MDAQELKLFYAGFPATFIKAQKINPVKLEQITELLACNKPLLLTKGLDKLAVYLVSNFMPVKEIKGIYFPDLYQNLLKGDLNLAEVELPKYTVIYGIGSEAVNSKVYAGNILKSLIDKCSLLNNTIVLSGVNQAILKRDYELTDVSFESIFL